MRVMLVYSNRTRLMEPAPPIGLSYVATATKRAGHNVRFVDLMMSREPLADLRAALEEFQPEVAGFSVRNIDNVIAQRTSWHLDEVREMIATVRAHSSARVVLGGPAASILGPLALERLDADFVVVGEGETAFPRLLSALEGQCDYSSVEGLCFRAGGKIISIPPVRRETFGRSGMEQWIRWRAYERAGGTWAVHTKRGCPMECLYCNYPVMEGRRLRCRDAADVVDEIEHVRHAVGPRTFEFTDSTFNAANDATAVQFPAKLPTLAEVATRLDRIDGRIATLAAATPAAGPAASFIAVNQTWDQGWRARVDGILAPILRTDISLSGVLVPPGEHRVEFEYFDDALAAGLALSVVAALACLAMVLLARRRTRDYRPGSE